MPGREAPASDEPATIRMLRATPLLIQVVPQLKPRKCGVTDHAIPLAVELKRGFGIDTAFVVLNSNERCGLPHPVIYCAPAQLLESCLALSAGQPGAILVHVSGYGYSADGAPALLAENLAKVRADGRFGIAAYFHEVSASGAPWTRAFWLARRQKKAAGKIAAQCDLIATNIGAHAKWLEQETTRQPAAPIHLLPVLSTIGEARERNPVERRTPAMAVFGLPATRQRAYKELLSLSGVTNALAIGEIVDIGAGLAGPESVNGIPVRHKGELEAADLARELSGALCGFLSYPANCLGKSSIFAAYCAQGAIPVIAKPFTGELDGLTDGVQLLSPRTVHAALQSGLDRCSLAAWQWYSGHRTHVHAGTYARWLDRSVPTSEREHARR